MAFASAPAKTSTKAKEVFFDNEAYQKALEKLRTEVPGFFEFTTISAKFEGILKKKFESEAIIVVSSTDSEINAIVKPLIEEAIQDVASARETQKIREDMAARQAAAEKAEEAKQAEDKEAKEAQDAATRLGYMSLTFISNGPTELVVKNLIKNLCCMRLHEFKEFEEKSPNVVIKIRGKFPALIASLKEESEVIRDIKNKPNGQKKNDNFEKILDYIKKSSAHNTPDSAIADTVGRSAIVADEKKKDKFETTFGTGFRHFSKFDDTRKIEAEMDQKFCLIATSKLRKLLKLKSGVDIGDYYRLQIMKFLSELKTSIPGEDEEKRIDRIVQKIAGVPAPDYFESEFFIPFAQGAYDRAVNRIKELQSKPGNEEQLTKLKEFFQYTTENPSHKTAQVRLADTAFIEMIAKSIVGISAPVATPAGVGGTGTAVGGNTSSSFSAPKKEDKTPVLTADQRASAILAELKAMPGVASLEKAGKVVELARRKIAELAEEKDEPEANKVSRALIEAIRPDSELNTLFHFHETLKSASGFAADLDLKYLKAKAEIRKRESAKRASSVSGVVAGSGMSGRRGDRVGVGNTGVPSPVPSTSSGPRSAIATSTTSSSSSTATGLSLSGSSPLTERGRESVGASSAPASTVSSSNATTAAAKTAPIPVPVKR